MTASAPVELVLSRVDGVKATGSGHWDARCPAHDDHRQSLSVTEGDDGRVLLRCHAGCPTESVVAAMDLTMADLFLPRETNMTRQIVEEYEYVDEAGKLLSQVVRHEPKGFRQRKPDGNEE